MNPVVQIIKWAAKIFVGLLLLVFISLHLYRSYLKNSTKIETPNGISLLEEITLGGVKQELLVNVVLQECQDK